MRWKNWNAPVRQRPERDKLRDTDHRLYGSEGTTSNKTIHGDDMIELLGIHGPAAAEPAAELVKDVHGRDASWPRSFEASRETAVIVVDFLGRMVWTVQDSGANSAIAGRRCDAMAGGAVKLVKVDVDKNQQFAGQLARAVDSGGLRLR